MNKRVSNLSRTNFSNEDIQEIIRLRTEEKWGYEKIAKKFNRAHTTIKTLLISEGVGHRDNRVGENNINWVGGSRVIDKNGYVSVYIHPDSPYISMKAARGLCMEHRLVMAEHLGRPLTPDETVHHIDGNRQNNKIENLQLRKGKHGMGSKYECGDCGSHNIVPKQI